MQNTLLLLWLTLLIQVLKEWFKFDYVYINFLNKTGGQTWCQKSQTIYNLERMEYFTVRATFLNSDDAHTKLMPEGK